MLEIVSTVATDYSVAEYMRHGEVVQATSRPPMRASCQKHLTITRSFIGVPSRGRITSADSTPSALSETAPLIIAPKRAGDSTIRELASFRNFLKGWDGEDAAAPDQQSITQAVLFVHACASIPGLPGRLIATLHADGSAILEINDGVDATLNFEAGGNIIYSIDGIAPGQVSFDGKTIPGAIKNALVSN
ncbi:hypothetical protein [Methylobacterium sp. V23]|uniref:hypothetical protein n=1 Tax=Methylobacterium sp. V23 TaxID=2044878 RepID=UPI0011AFF0A1|nr:hypothetical protein [Methylobacterium sp. V23]